MVFYIIGKHSFDGKTYWLYTAGGSFLWGDVSAVAELFLEEDVDDMIIRAARQCVESDKLFSQKVFIGSKNCV